MGSERRYIDNLKIEDIPWNRMVSAYGTAKDCPEYFKVLDSLQNIDEMNETLDNIMSEIEHQSTFFSPAPFALVFLVRILEKAKNTNTPEAEWLINTINKRFGYFLELCDENIYSEYNEAFQPLPNISDLLDEKYLLPKNYTEDDLEEYYENFMPDDCFYSLYYYSKKVISGK